MTIITLIIGGLIGAFIGTTFLDGNNFHMDQPKEIIKYVYLGGDPDSWKGTIYELPSKDEITKSL